MYQYYSSQKIGKKINQLIANWNVNQDRLSTNDDGVFHSSEVYKIESNMLIYRIDFGSASEKGILSIFEELNNFDVESVRISSYP